LVQGDRAVDDECLRSRTLLQQQPKITSTDLHQNKLLVVKTFSAKSLILLKTDSRIRLNPRRRAKRAARGGAIAARAGDSPVAIQGYTDSLGGESYSQRLSGRRAVAVKSWLGANEGLVKMQFTIAGFGARNPAAPDRKPDGSDDPEGRQRNRRVTFIIPK
jgi:outer membrane protein OmpA-like peptidoglycan-associated protein